MSKKEFIEYENLKTANEAFFPEIEAVIKKVILSGRYILGDEVIQFENEFANYVGGKFCIGVGNGLDALILSIQALNLPINSEILVASNTYIATVLAIIKAGYKPILVEPDPITFNIDPHKIEASITTNTRAICVTHLFGKPCRMDLICNLAAKYDLRLVEDCAQSHGAKFNGRQTGTFGDVGCFSFYPTKNLGAMGDAGAIITNDEEIADRLRYLRNYGSKIKYHNEYIGANSRLDEIQAAILRVKLKFLENFIAHKRRLANIYFEGLPNWISAPSLNADEYDVFHIYGVRVLNRNNLKSMLLEQGVSTEIHYPVPPHKQPALSGSFKGRFPIAEELHATELSLPISIGHTEQQIMRVCNILSSKDFQAQFLSL